MQFEKLYKSVMKSFSVPAKSLAGSGVVKETSMAGAGGVFGGNAEIGAHGGDVGNRDWYAPGDARNIFGGYVSAKQGKKKKKVIRRTIQRRM